MSVHLSEKSKKNPISIAITVFVRLDYERLLCGFLFELANGKAAPPLIFLTHRRLLIITHFLLLATFYEAISNSRRACAAKLLQ